MAKSHTQYPLSDAEQTSDDKINQRLSNLRAWGERMTFLKAVHVEIEPLKRSVLDDICESQGERV